MLRILNIDNNIDRLNVLLYTVFSDEKLYHPPLPIFFRVSLSLSHCIFAIRIFFIKEYGNNINRKPVEAEFRGRITEG